MHQGDSVKNRQNLTGAQVVIAGIALRGEGEVGVDADGVELRPERRPLEGVEVRGVGDGAVVEGADSGDDVVPLGTRLAARQLGVAVLALAPSEVKRAVTGNGAAGKAQVQRAVQTLLGLESLPRPSHVADALGLALTGMARITGRLPMGRAIRGPAPR